MAFVNNPAVVFRDFATDGVPSSGPWSPRKVDIRALLAERDAWIQGQVRQSNPGNRVYVSTLGNDANDGSAGGASAKRTLAAAFTFLRNSFDWKGSPPTVFVEAGTYAGFEFQGHPVGYHFAYLEGQGPGTVTIQPPTGSLASIVIGDYAALIAKNIRVASTGSGQFGWFEHQHAILDLFEGNRFAAFPGGVGIANDVGAAVVNISNDIVVEGSMSELLRMTAGGAATLAGAKSIIFQNSPTFFNLFNANAAGSNIIFGGGRAFSGGCTITGRALQCSPGSTISKSGNSFPSASSPDGGGGDIH